LFKGNKLNINTPSPGMVVGVSFWQNAVDASCFPPSRL
jgi:hypothetical protein